MWALPEDGTQHTDMQGNDQLSDRIVGCFKAVRRRRKVRKDKGSQSERVHVETGCTTLPSLVGEAPDHQLVLFDAGEALN